MLSLLPGSGQISREFQTGRLILTRYRLFIARDCRQYGP